MTTAYKARGPPSPFVFDHFKKRTEERQMQKWHEYHNYRRYKNADGSYTYTITVDGETVEVERDVYRAYAYFARKMKYMELDLKRNRALQDADGKPVMDQRGVPILLPEREVSLERLTDGGWDIAVETAQPEDDLLRRLERDDLRRCLSLLSPDERELIELLYFTNDGAGMSERDCIEVLGLSKTAIHARKVRIIKKIKNSMRE